MKMFWLLQDAHNFLNQFLPNPVSLFVRYKFSPADLERVAPKHHLVPTNKGLFEASADGKSILQTFDVLTYNINTIASSSRRRRRSILRAIFSSGANVILLQETNPSWEKLLIDDADALQYSYRYFHHPHKGDKDRPPDQAASGIAVLSQYPLKSVDILDFSQDVAGSVFPALVCKVMLPLSLLDHDHYFFSEFSELSTESTVGISVANVHLRPPLNLDGSAWFDTARKTEPIRLAEVKKLLQRGTSLDCSLNDSNLLQPDLDIIAGDFNEDNFGAALSHLSNSLGYSDALQQFVPMRKETHTWPFLRNMWTLRKRLDHILWRDEQLSVTTKNGRTQRMLRLKCLGCGVLTGYEIGASDHQPVLSRFGIMLK